jgi:hypothetical protein
LLPVYTYLTPLLLQLFYSNRRIVVCLLCRAYLPNKTLLE